LRFGHPPSRQPAGGASTGHSLPARSGPRVALAGIYAVTLLTILYVAGSFSGELQKHLVPSELGQIIIGFAAAAFLFYRGKQRGWSWPWLLLSASMAFTQVATVVVFISYYIDGVNDAPWYLSIVYLLAYPLIFVALLLLAREDRRAMSKNALATFGRWLDSAIVLVGGGMAVVYVGVIPALNAKQGDTSSIAFIVCDAFLILFMLTAATYYALLPGRTLRPMAKILLIVGMVGSLCTFVLMTAQEATGRYLPGNSADGFFVLALGALSWAGYLGSDRRVEDDVAPRRLPVPVKSLLPLLAVVLGLTLLVLQGRGQLWSPLGKGILSTVALVLLVVVRQVVVGIESARLEAQKAALRIEKRFRSLVTHSSDIIIVTDPDTTISFGTPSSERLFGAKAIGGIGARLLDVLAPESQTEALATIAGCLERSRAEAAGRWLMRDGKGCWRHFDVVIVNLLEEPTVGGLVFTMRDVEERVRFEAQLEHQVFYDALTGIGNRVLFGDRLRHALTRAKRAQTQVAVLYADLDDFKMVNDTGGHVLGDRLLVEVAKRIEGALRASDTPARLSGDEFAVLIEDLVDPLQATHVAEELLECIRRPFMIGANELIVSASIGMVLCDGDETPEEVMRHADTAMYEAKRAGGDRFDVFEPSMQAAIHRRLELQTDMRRGAFEREFTVYYQAVVDMTPGQADRVVAVEALVRWRHPQAGLLAPADFLDVAEQTGLVTTLGRQVLEEACGRVKAWNDALPSARQLSVAVNFSPRQLREPSVVTMVSEVLEATGLEPDRLVMEVTEDALIEGEQPTNAKLWALKELGVRLAIDDFGTGYSSLSRLSAFPFDYVKIDRQFVRRVSDGRQESAVARSIIGLAHSLGLYAVAEGIEREEQRRRLVDLGCSLGQGFLFSEPLDAERMTALLLADEAAPVC
jgi:diguanylate cyclase (GGDEF)-like protein/PAS domain S-box-containing protein